jgi:hypothetical protein
MDKTFGSRLAEWPNCVLYTQQVLYNGEYFEEDKQMVIYKRKEEMIDKSKLYLNIQNHSVIRKMKQESKIRSD